MTKYSTLLFTKYAVLFALGFSMRREKIQCQQPPYPLHQTEH